MADIVAGWLVGLVVGALFSVRACASAWRVTARLEELRGGGGEGGGQASQGPASQAGAGDAGEQELVDVERGGR